MDYDQAMRFLAAMTLLVLAIAMAQPVSAQSFKPDFKAGIAAWKQKDYATALKRFRPLSEQGNIPAHYSLGRMHLYYPRLQASPPLVSQDRQAGR